MVSLFLRVSNPTPLLEAGKGSQGVHGHHKIPWTASSDCSPRPLDRLVLLSCTPVNPTGIPWKPKVHLAVHFVLSAGRFGNPSSFTSQSAPSLHDLDVHNRTFLQPCSSETVLAFFFHGGANITTEASAIRWRPSMFSTMCCMSTFAFHCAWATRSLTKIS